MSKCVLRLRERETEECERSWGSPGSGVTGTQGELWSPVFCPVPVDEPWEVCHIPVVAEGLQCPISLSARRGEGQCLGP